MSKKPIEEPLNSDLATGVFMPNDETGFMVATAENVISAYEKAAGEILKEKGYPTTLDELWAKRDKVLPDLARGGSSPVYSIFWMFMFFKDVRDSLQKNNADAAVCNMAAAISWATAARLAPLTPKINIGEAFTDGRNKGYSGKILQPKQTREAFAKYLVKKYPHLDPRQLAAKILDETRSMIFRHQGNDLKVYRAYKKGRFGKTTQCVRFESSTGNHFDFAMETFVDTIRKKVQ
jgi:hypothetical protein